MARGRPIEQGGHVPRTADDGDPFVARALRGADLAAHRGLAELVEWVLVGELRSDRDHRLADGLEDVCGGAAGLDEAVPPALAVGLAGGAGELAEGVSADRCREVGGPLGGFLRGVAGFGGFGVVARLRLGHALLRELREQPLALARARARAGTRRRGR